MRDLREKTKEVTLSLQRMGFRVIEMWEHEFNSQKKTNTGLISFLKTLDIQDRLNPRESFFGGRTNAIKLYSEGHIKYIDFTSLYPWTNKYCR